MIMCPYCLTMQAPQQTNQCSNPKCGQKLPSKYLENARSGNLICLGTYGLPSHGKTAFLSSLMQSALAVSKIVPGSYVSTLDDDTRKKLNEWSALYREGRVKPPATPPSERPKPLLSMSKNFPPGHATILAAYDLAGEALKQAGSQPEYVRALKQVNTIWCIVSLEDLLNHNEDGYSLDSLFNIYLDAMTEHHISIKGKNILVMYTKADLLLRAIWRLEPLPPEVIEYLATDPYDQLRDRRGAELPPFDADAYFSQMLQISNILREYTIDFVDGGAAFVNMIDDEGAQVYFTINSAYGDALDSGNTLGIKVRSIRVLDALIWAVMLNTSAVSEQEVALIVPPTIESAGLASQETIARFYDELTGQGGHVATYYPGQAEPAFPLGIRPGSVRSSGNLPLIGPILDRLKPGTAVVLLVKDTLPLDFGDLYASQWMDKLLLVVARRDLAAGWLPHRGIFTQEGEIAPMVSAFLQKISTSRM